jgi:hypothetical protein
MNSNPELTASTIDIADDESTSIDDDQHSQTHITRSSADSTSSNGTKHPKEISPCHVCGAKAHGYNFDQSNKIEKFTDVYLIIKI